MTIDSFTISYILIVVLLIFIAGIIKTIYDYKHCHKCGKWISKGNLIRLQTYKGWGGRYYHATEIVSYHKNKECSSLAEIIDKNIKKYGKNVFWRSSSLET